MKTSNTYTHPALQSEITDQSALYCGTYAKYNNGSIFGKWIDLTLVYSKEELYEICLAIHADETDPELMFQDFQSIDDSLIGESWISDDFFAVQKVIDQINDMDSDNLVSLNNTYCQENNYSDSEIYNNDEDFFETFFSGNVTAAVRAAIYGEYNYHHDYVKFNGYANLESMDSITTDDLPESVLTIARYIVENPREFSHLIDL